MFFFARKLVLSSSRLIGGRVPPSCGFTKRTKRDTKNLLLLENHKNHKNLKKNQKGPQHNNQKKHNLLAPKKTAFWPNGPVAQSPVQDGGKRSWPGCPLPTTPCSWWKWQIQRGKHLRCLSTDMLRLQSRWKNHGKCKESLIVAKHHLLFSTVGHIFYAT